MTALRNRCAAAPSRTRWSKVRDSGQHGAQGNGPFVGDRFLQEPPDAQNGDLRQVQHRGGEDAADRAVIADGEGAAAQVGQRNAARVGQFGKMLHLRRKGQEGFAVHVLHHRHDQALGACRWRCRGGSSA